jgi:NADH-quinone oxidoreductase E subunit
MKKTEGTKFEFNAQNLKKANQIIAKYPEARQASAVLPLLDIAQRQNGGWVSQDIIEYIANFLNMPNIRVQEVASFYTMFNLKPVGKFHIQVCGTTPCWLRGAENVMKTIKDKLKIRKGDTTEDGLFTLTEVECLGACVNAPMVQINDDYFEDLTEESIIDIIDSLKEGKSVKLGSQIGRNGSQPLE